MTGTITVSHTVALPETPKGAEPEQITQMISAAVTGAVNEAVNLAREKTGMRPVVMSAAPATTQVRGRLYLTVSIVMELTPDQTRSGLLVPNGPTRVGLPS